MFLIPVCLELALHLILGILILNFTLLNGTVGLLNTNHQGQAEGGGGNADDDGGENQDMGNGLE